MPTHEQFRTLMSEVFEECLVVQDKKGRDYAGESDALAVFKAQGQRINITPEQAWAVLADKGWNAIIAHASGKKLLDESLRSRVHDIINYSVFLLALAEDETPDAAREQIDKNVASLKAGILSEPGSGSLTVPPRPVRPNPPQTVVEPGA